MWKDKIIDYVVKNGPGLAGAMVVIAAGIVVARFAGNLLMRWLDKRQMEPPVKMLLTRITRLLVVAFAAVIAAGTCGINIAPLVAGIGVAGVGIGLAMQGVLGNLICGLLIIFTKPFRIGEYIEIIGCYGQVNAIELFSTVLLHPDRSRVIIPNRKIVGEVLHNYGTVRQHDIRIGVAYDTNIPEAVALVKEVLSRSPRVLKDPVAVVALGNFGDSAIEILVRPWTPLAEFGDAAQEVKLAVLEAFRGRKIEIPFPQREVRVINGANNNLAVGAGGAARLTS
jgi:small conductance mechanosensitive channel